MRSRPSLITRLDIKSGNLITVRSTGGRNIAGVYLRLPMLTVPIITSPTTVEQTRVDLKKGDKGGHKDKDKDEESGVGQHVLV